MNDNVNHPAHYTSGPLHSTCGQPIEAIDVTSGHTFSAGNAMKYLWRHLHKGTPVDDLRKAAWYATDEAARLEALQRGDTLQRPLPGIDCNTSHATHWVGEAGQELPREDDPADVANDYHADSPEQDSAVKEDPTLPDAHQPRTSTVRAVFGDSYIGTLECSCGHFVAGVQGVTRSRLVLDLSSVYTKHLRDVWGA